MRHTKLVVGDELFIPPQKRYVITMPFTAVEEQHYQSLFRQLAELCGLDTHGAPLRPDWDPNDSAVLEAMRSALNRLRKTALHPEIGDQNRRALGHRAGPIRTLADVLDTMIEQSESSLRVDRRAILTHKLKRGQMLENSPRVQLALKLWQDVLKESKALVQAAREKLISELEKAKEAGVNEPDGKPHNGRYDDDSESDENDADDQDKAAGGRVGDAQRELRYALEIQHRAEFFCANAYFQIKSNETMTALDSDEFRRLGRLETEGYERAKRVRQEILQENRGKARRKMEELSGKAASQSFTVIPECVFAKPGGIEGRRIAEELEEFGGLLNDQANQIDSWREAVIQLLLKDLVDEDDEIEITGDEYENSTKVQDEIQAYLTILKAAISDRHVALTGIAPSELAKYEEQVAYRLAENNDGPAPKLMMRLFKERQAVVPDLQGKQSPWSLRAALVSLRERLAKLRIHANSDNRRAQVEQASIMEQLKSTQEQQTEQTKAVAMLEKEAKKVRSALNTRIAFYRQLQIVSDMVALYEGARDDEAITAAVQEEENLGNALATAEAKHRYLVHLKETNAKDEHRLCVICQSTFVVGVLTVCGHQFCKECMTAWFQAHHNCPMCKRKLSLANLHNIVLKPQALKVVSESAAEGDHGDHGDNSSGSSRGDVGEQFGRQTGRSKKTGIYSNFSADQLDMDLPGPSFTTKVDTLIRHLLWLRSSDPGTKAIVFSQFPEFLVILAQAFTHYHIGFSRFSDCDGIAKFKEDPSIECFLLHARAHSSGLNLVNANHVILCEPLVNTALELQAIARVHRIGQENETTVWLYIVDGTVEESIYNLSVQRRMEHMGRNLRGKSAESTPELLDRNLELANSLEMQQAQLSKLMSKNKMAGEEVAKADLWNCLFGSSARRSAAATEAADEEQLQNNALVRRHLLASVAEERQE
ncbi:snf2 family helicase [Grosmannia clavigera kw1407]|uniref:Snf2 family helicase n=1 Tax=Grosmannia clavigera (strain kw1407 / UAMH 11150) TaxID=655863 RepID=F0XMB0_GROCL|nr:snf2 family helicase [Grosmannia clavigera kw1407]EFX01034.1 snf2 family helicase [Grosmannia clavigera kw1407]